ncbi:MAG TPA: hypothetical protein VK939_14565 [Longimicrobiales bacterium]|nr:hypothetical protein [Longimicrobiales bacterium]
MADEVHIHNDPPPTRGGSSAWVWGLVVLVLLAVIVWLVMGQGRGSGVPDEIDVNIETPAAPNPQ